MKTFILTLLLMVVSLFNCKKEIKTDSATEVNGVTPKLIIKKVEVAKWWLVKPFGFDPTAKRIILLPYGIQGC